MYEKTIVAAAAPPPTEHQSAAEKRGSDHDGQRYSTSTPSRQPSASYSPPGTARSGQNPRRTSPKPGQVTEAGHPEDHEPSVYASELESSQATVAHTSHTIEAQTKNGKGPTQAGSRQERHTLRSLRIPSPSHPSRRDLEKALAGRNSPHSHRSTTSTGHHHSTTVYSLYDEADEEDDPKEHAMWILIYLSLLAPLVSLLTSLYALIATIVILMLSPLCLCMTANLLKANLRRFLAPPLSLQLRLIYSDFDDDEGEEEGGGGGSSGSINSDPTKLILVNILAPLYALGICLAAWVAAGFWVVAAILGDPNVKNSPGKKSNHREEKKVVSPPAVVVVVDNNYDGNTKDDDGKKAVMSVRRWWERWLVSGLRR